MDTTVQELLTLKELLTGGLPTAYWIALFIFFNIGATIYQGAKVRQGIVKKETSPDKFSPVYFFTDTRNYFDFAIAILSAYVFIRFADKFIGEQGIAANIDWMLLASVGLGAGWQLLADKVIDALKKAVKVVFG
jgi:hypothetical protein